MNVRTVKAALAGLMMATVTAGQVVAADCAGEAGLKSEPGGSATDITFHNGSDAQRRIYWIDTAGQRKLKAVVEAGQTSRQPTVASHHWVVTGPRERCLYVVTASQAPMTVEVGGTAAAAPEAASPVAAGGDGSATQRYGLSGWYQIKSMSKPGFGLNNLDTGYPELERTKNDWQSAYWVFDDVRGTPFVTIKNKWTGKYLHDDRGSLRVAESSPSAEGAHWLLEGAADGPYGRIKNRRDGRYLVTIPSGFDLVAAPDPGNASQWQFVRTAGPVPVSAPAYVPPPAVTKPVREPEPPVRAGRDKCSRHETWIRHRGCVLKQTLCTRHQVYSSSMGQCIPKSAMCEKNQVYSSSLAQCISKVQPKPVPKPVPPVKPKIPKCKYKADGPGNCLTPAFLQCKKSFGACIKACGALQSCKKNCNKTYGNKCGDE